MQLAYHDDSIYVNIMLENNINGSRWLCKEALRGALIPPKGKMKGGVMGE